MSVTVCAWLFNVRKASPAISRIDFFKVLHFWVCTCYIGYNGYMYERLGSAGFVPIPRHKRRCVADSLYNHLTPNVLSTMLWVVIIHFSVFAFQTCQLLSNQLQYPIQFLLNTLVYPKGHKSFQEIQFYKVVISVVSGCWFLKSL
jgi:hypothetical protein